MPRGRTRKRATAKNRATRSQHATVQAKGVQTRARSDGQPRLQQMMMSAMVALGCWGFALTFIFWTNDPNRYLFGGMAAVLALMWSVNFVVRLRKWQQNKSE